MSRRTAPKRVLVSVGDPERDGAAGYAAALAGAGVPEEIVEITAPREDADYRERGAEALGLVLAGGDTGKDVAPEHYGEAAIPEAGIDAWPPRDAMELALLEGARDARVPVWGVCRGVQVLNVFFGGTLWQDLALQVPTRTAHQVSSPRDALVHPVRLREGAAAIGLGTAPDGGLDRGRDELLVNSRHHQAIKDLAPGLTPVAEAPDGLVEAVRLEDEEWWVAGVQWHPENLTAMAAHRRPWAAFARTARTRHERGGRR